MENSSMYQQTQLGLEITPGTTVAATKRLTSISITPSIMPEVNTYRPNGYKFTTIASLSKEWSEYSIEGPITYNEIIYLLNSLIKKVTPTGAGANKTSVFAPNSNGSDVRQTYTIENGSAERARQTAYGLVTGLDLNFDRNEVKCSGTIMGKAISDNVALTSLLSSAEIPVMPVLPTQGIIKLADTQAGLAGATPLARAFKATWSLNSLSGPVWPINSTTTYAALVDTAPTAEGTLMAAVDAEGMALLTNLRAGSTKFLRIAYTGETLGTGNYSLQIDTAIKVKDVKQFSDMEGVYAVEWGWDMVHDSTWGKATEITVVNALTAL
jgi:hypothetical protein